MNKLIVSLTTVVPSAAKKKYDCYKYDCNYKKLYR